MPRFVYPPHDFKCLYRHCCPYLDGLSTQWVLEEYRRAGEVYQEHLRIIDSVDGNLKARDERIRVLERENAELKARFQALRQRQFKSNKKKSIETGGKEVENVSSSMEKEKKKRGPPVGIRDGYGPSRTVLTGPWKCLLRRSARIANLAT